MRQGSITASIRIICRCSRATRAWMRSSSRGRRASARNGSRAGRSMSCLGWCGRRSAPGRWRFPICRWGSGIRRFICAAGRRRFTARRRLFCSARSRAGTRAGSCRSSFLGWGVRMRRRRSGISARWRTRIRRGGSMAISSPTRSWASRMRRRRSMRICCISPCARITGSCSRGSTARRASLRSCGPCCWRSSTRSIVSRIGAGRFCSILPSGSSSRSIRRCASPAWRGSGPTRIRERTGGCTARSSALSPVWSRISASASRWRR